MIYCDATHHHRLAFHQDGKIYSVKEIDKAKQSPSFEREYNLKYLGRIGNVFHTKAAIEKGRKYSVNPDTFSIVNNRWFPKSMGIDPAWGSSAFGIVITQFADGLCQIRQLNNTKGLITMKCYLLCVS